MRCELASPSENLQGYVVHAGHIEMVLLRGTAVIFNLNISNVCACFGFLSELSLAQRKFAQCLGEFQFEYIGDAKTDDEKCIGE